MYWNRSLDEDLENGIDYEDRRFYGDYSFDDFEDEKLQAAIKQLTPRQREILRLVYIEGRTQKEVAKILHRAESSISDNLQTIYKRINQPCKMLIGTIWFLVTMQIKRIVRKKQIL